MELALKEKIAYFNLLFFSPPSHIFLFIPARFIDSTFLPLHLVGSLAFDITYSIKDNSL